MPKLEDVLGAMGEWFPEETAEEWDAVGLVAGDPADPVETILLAVDPTIEVAREAAEMGAGLLITHHPLFLRGVHGVPATTPKGRTLQTLQRAGCALLTAHTNADRARGGVSEAMARALGIEDPRPVLADADPTTGQGRIGAVRPTTLGAYADLVAARLPNVAQGVRFAGDPDRPVRRVAVCGGAGDFLLDQVLGTDADVYVTSDLRHHPAAEFLEKRGPALIDVAHWAAEWTFLPVLAERLRSHFGGGVRVEVSEIVTDPWTGRGGS